MTSRGVVIGADSRQSVAYPTQDGGVIARKTTDFADKVFKLNAQTIAATFGLASVSGEMIDVHVNRFQATLDDSLPADVVGSRLSTFFTALLEQAVNSGHVRIESPPHPLVGFLIGGHHSGGGYHLERMHLPGGIRIQELSGLGTPSFMYSDNEAIHRLLKGVDPRMDLPEEVTESLPGFEYVLDLGESLQEMIDFANFTMELAVNTERFTNGIYLQHNGTEVSSPPFDIAAVSHSGAHWVKRKAVSS